MRANAGAPFTHRDGLKLEAELYVEGVYAALVVNFSVFRIHRFHALVHQTEAEIEFPVVETGSEGGVETALQLFVVLGVVESAGSEDAAADAP